MNKLTFDYEARNLENYVLKCPVRNTRQKYCFKGKGMPQII